MATVVLSVLAREHHMDPLFDHRKGPWPPILADGSRLLHHLANPLLESFYQILLLSFVPTILPKPLSSFSLYILSLTSMHLAHERVWTLYRFMFNDAHVRDGEG